MAIDTAAKRNSAIATRRLPWFRRFAPLPDGAVMQTDRQQDGFFFIGIPAGLPVPAIGAVGMSIEWSRRIVVKIEWGETG